MGAIGEIVRRTMPATYDGLTGSDGFSGGTDDVQEIIEDQKAIVLGDAAPLEVDEVDLTRIMRLFIGKRAALEMITPGIDYWRRNPISVATTGTNEVETFSDPVIALEALRKKLISDITALQPDVAPDINTTRSQGPRVSDGNSDTLLTPNADDFGPAFQRPGITSAPTLG